jgi:tellurite methyltransferase
MDLAGWNQRYLEQPEIAPPVPLVRKIAETIRPGRALDLACGTGRNALWLSQQGWDVTAVDGSSIAIAALRVRAPGICTTVADLEAHEYTIEPAAWDLIVVTYYLQRDLFEPAKAGLKPDGTMIAIVHTTEKNEEPTAHRLRPGELVTYFEGWEILHQHEGSPDESGHQRRSAEVVARRYQNT